MEDLAVVRDIVEDDIEGEEFATGAVRLRRKVSKLNQVGEEIV